MDQTTFQLDPSCATDGYMAIDNTNPCLVPWELDWGEAATDNLDTDPSVFVKGEAFDNIDLSAIPTTSFWPNNALDTGNSTCTDHDSSRAPFGGLIDPDGKAPSTPAQADTMTETPHHQRYETPFELHDVDTVSYTTPAAISPSSDKSPYSGCTTSSRKRKSCDSGIGSCSHASMSPPLSPAHKRTSHNMIEKRYRTNLNEKISGLRNAVPALRMLSCHAAPEEESDDQPSGQKLSKAAILSKATEYIRALEKKIEKAGWENAELRNRVASLETMVLNGMSAYCDGESHRHAS